MKILLVGEFSGVHTHLSKALKDMGHIVTTISDGDAYKNFPRDITIPLNKNTSKWAVLKDYIYDYLGIKGLFLYFKKRKTLSELRGFDIVQLINPAPIAAFGSLASLLLLKKLERNNNKLFLCALGDDYRWVSACLSGTYKYSALDNLSVKTFPKYLYTLKYKYGFFYKTLHLLTEKKCRAIIPGLYDYQLAYNGHPKITDIVKLPIEPLKNESSTNAQGKNNRVVIFHGWQVGKEFRKGNFIFDAAMQIILKKYGEERVQYIVCKSVPYSDYILLVSQADLFLDQVYSYDFGVNALLGMKYSSVVLSGFECYSDGIGINVEPELSALVEKISFLIENPLIVEDIKTKARSHVKIHHDAMSVSRKYLEIWEKY
ncbi:glycosyltransferase family 1 protein [Salmonella enterica subsp. arizonae serovar 63:z36:-]|uniref:Glycosyltransferase n=1 Tax=Salmonella enterica TaxID=28901 RepID=U3GK55_SALER|nr:glycosyltransferase [Salmonella enterica]AXC76711.1 glycosyltransferase family 1 protein [Salmonella enterica subsp. arizonae serovar 63:g,z51:-]EAT8922682.1 glycosyltransferase family 1 protein [Salmonella enterica subsp. arizonae serovar 63:z4,z32:-]EAV6588804.1 glycosyltransferase family 1 protein [Salmonella enterica subsp. arizonae serovar 63:z4,z23:-]EAV7066397.1 glycosyltransferase family 1 protein [Salmonella enterica subsp. arizonae serovar 63:z36:-]KSB78658.1 hypothetical protein 